jgi:hypothetical protein
MSSYEDYILSIFRKEKIEVEREKTFRDLRHNKTYYRFDFYLPKEKILIEVDGQYHWRPIRGRQALLKQQENDRLKNSFCLAHKIPLYRIPYWELENIKKFKDIKQNKFLVRTKWHNDNLVKKLKQGGKW